MALLRLGVAAALLAVVLPALPVQAQAVPQDEALALAFPGADLERRTAFLDAELLARASELAGPDVEVEASVITYYVARRAGRPVGVAYFDAHRVRTLPEVLMIVVDPEGRIGRIETVGFREPPEYRAPDGWLRQLDGRALDDALTLKGDIANITGATLTAGAVTRAARRVLALHRLIDPLAEPAR